MPPNILRAQDSPNGVIPTEMSTVPPRETHAVLEVALYAGPFGKCMEGKVAGRGPHADVGCL